MRGQRHIASWKLLVLGSPGVLTFVLLATACTSCLTLVSTAAARRVIVSSAVPILLFLSAPYSCPGFGVARSPQFLLSVIRCSSLFRSGTSHRSWSASGPLFAVISPALPCWSRHTTSTIHIFQCVHATLLLTSSATGQLLSYLEMCPGPDETSSVQWRNYAIDTCADLRQPTLQLFNTLRSACSASHARRTPCQCPA